MRILITNIGNRNIKYKGQVYSKLESKEGCPAEQLSFRNWTKQLLDNYESEKENIQLNILDTVLNQTDFKPDRIIVVVSNQQDAAYIGQDTLYEGEIIKRILSKKYQIADTELKELTDDVTSDNYLMQFYQKLYLELLQKFPEAHFVFCDAGGTGQQKTACKLMAEFILSDVQWKILYPKEDGSIEEKTQVEYRNIINKEQAIALVRKSQYEAALNVLGGDIHANSDNDVFLLLSFAHYRIRRVSQQVRMIWDNKSWPYRTVTYIKSACFPKERKYSEKLLNSLSEKSYLELSELLYVAYHYYRIENYIDSFLSFAVFYETYIDKCLRLLDKEIKKCFSAKVGKKTGELTEAYLNSEGTLFPETVRYAKNALNNSDTLPDYKSVPLAIHLISEQDIICELCELATILTPFLDFSKPDYNQDRKEENSIRSIRNKLAHEGVYINRAELSIRSPHYGDLLKQCLKAWGLPVEEDVYEQINRIIEQQIRKTS
jgi:hypothetical protein